MRPVDMSSLNNKTILTLVPLTLLFFAAFVCAAGTAVPFQPFKPFTFAVIADPHVSDPLRDRPDSSVKMYEFTADLLRAAICEINKVEGLDFTIVLGDLTRDAEPWNVQLFKEIMGSLSSPYYVVLGNHDINPGDASFAEYKRGESRSYMIDQFQGHGFKGSGAHWSLDPFPNVHLVGLDTNIEGDWGGELSLEGLNFLKNDLSLNREKLTLVMLHHLLVPYTRPVREGVNGLHKFVAYNAEEIRFIIESFPQVVMTLSGHRHLSTRYVTEKNISYFTLPSTAVWPMSYVVFNVSQGEIRYSTHDVLSRSEIRQKAKSRLLAEEANFWKNGSGFSTSSEKQGVLAETLFSEHTRSGTIQLTPSGMLQNLP